jgi:hypothetical protein
MHNLGRFRGSIVLVYYYIQYFHQGVIMMVHTMQRDGEAIHIHVDDVVARKSTQNERARRFREV